MGFMQGKRALIVGAVSNRSIAYGIAAAMHREGAELAFSYQNDKLAERVTKIAEEFDSELVYELDVASDAQIDGLFADLGKVWDGLDCIVHSVAYAPREQLEGTYPENLTRDGFQVAHDISSYSFAALAKAGRALMEGRNGSLLTLTYLGAERVVPHYNVMGVAKASLEANVRYLASGLGAHGTRVNAISAGPIRTLAASGIADFKRLLEIAARNSSLGRNVTIEEVGNAAAFLCSDLASGITGEVMYVDAGFNTQAMGI